MLSAVARPPVSAAHGGRTGAERRNGLRDQRRYQCQGAGGRRCVGRRRVGGVGGWPAGSLSLSLSLALSLPFGFVVHQNSAVECRFLLFLPPSQLVLAGRCRCCSVAAMAATDGKKFLRKPNDDGVSVYTHLTEVLASLLAQKPENALSPYFSRDDAFTGYCAATRKGSTIEIGVCDNDLGFCVLITGLLDGATFINIIKIAFGASSTTR